MHERGRDSKREKTIHESPNKMGRVGRAFCGDIVKDTFWLELGKRGQKPRVGLKGGKTKQRQTWTNQSEHNNPVRTEKVGIGKS